MKWESVNDALPYVSTSYKSTISASYRVDMGSLGIDILIKYNGKNVMGVDLKIGAKFPAAKRRDISMRAGNIPIVQILVGVK